VPLACEFCGQSAGECDCDDFTTAHLREPAANGEEESMERLLAVNGVLLNNAFIETVDYNPDGSVHVHFMSGNNRTFTGDEADGLRRYFQPIAENLPAAPAAEYPVTYIKDGQPDRIVQNGDERQQAITDGFVPAAAEAPTPVTGQPAPPPVVTRRR
jgi:hypothetical protein